VAIQDDFEIDEYLKRITHISGTTVYEVNSLYSWLQTSFQEPGRMYYQVPILGKIKDQAYTWLNGWWMNDESFKYLKTGSVITAGWDASTFDDGVRILYFTSITTPPIVGDIGEDVIGASSGTTAKLLNYDNTLNKWWVRMSDTADDFSTNENVYVSGGDGDGDLTVSDFSLTGENIYGNFYTIGTIESSPYPQVYVYQDSEKISSWWLKGHVDILVKIQETDNLIDNGLLSVYTRQFGDDFDHSIVDLSSGARTPVALSTSKNDDNINGSHYLLYDGWVSDFVIGETIGNGSGITNQTAFGEIIGITEVISNTEGILELGNVIGTFGDNEDLYVYNTTTQRGIVNGTAGDTLISYTASSTFDGEEGEFVDGTNTTAQRTIRGVLENTTDSYLVCESTIDPDDTDGLLHYTTFEDLEAITSTLGSGTTNIISSTLASGYKDIRLWFISGELEVADSSTFTAGKKVTGTSSGHIGWVISIDSVNDKLVLGNATGIFENLEAITDNGSGSSTAVGTMVSINTYDFAFTEQSTPYPYNLFVELGTRGSGSERTLLEMFEYMKYTTGESSLFQMYTQPTNTPEDGQEYIIAYTGYAPDKASPLGSYAGGAYFGPRGVWIQNMPPDEVISYQLIDADNILRPPPTTIINVVSGVVSGEDYIIVAPWDGITTDSNGDPSILKDQLTIKTALTTNNITVIETNENLPTDTPSSGTIRLADNNGFERKLHYTNWDIGTNQFLIDTTDGNEDFLYVNADVNNGLYITYIDALYDGTSDTDRYTAVYTDTIRNLVVIVRDGGVLSPIKQFISAWTFSFFNQVMTAQRESDE